MPLAAVEQPPPRFRGLPAPLLEKERDTSGFALAPNIAHPCWIKGPMSRSAFSSHNDPVDAVQGEMRNWSEKWFH